MIQKPKGTYDVTQENNKIILYIENIVRNMMDKYNYEYVRTPIFEASELFHRTVGETTDIVTKETYDFKDKADRNMTLRPEGTAGVVRSFVENKMYGLASQPVKTWYYGPMYRYENPQAGRFREFYQFGVEVFGSSNPYIDAEVISIPVNLYSILGLKNVKVRINTLGDKASRLKYRDALLAYFKPYLDDMCEDCKARYLKNPLRILDCKIDSKKDYFNDAPKMSDYLTDDSKDYYNKVKEYLEALDIEYIEDSNIVRGLDYYSHTVFEVQADVEGFGSQNVLCGGGRYNDLVSNLGGPNICGVGFALGYERLINALKLENIDINIDGIDIYIASLGENTKEYTVGLAQYLRLNGFKTDIDYLDRNLKSNFKQADRLDSKYIIIIGDEEIESKKLTIKDNKTKEEYKVAFEDLIEFLDERLEVNE